MVRVFFQTKHWAIHPASFWAFVYIFGSIWGCPNSSKWPKKHKKLVFWLFWTIWAPQMEPKRYLKARNCTRCMAQCLSLKMSPIPNHQAHSFRGNGPKHPDNRFFMLFFFHSEAIWAPSNRPNMVPKGPNQITRPILLG